MAGAFVVALVAVRPLLGDAGRPRVVVQTCVEWIPVGALHGRRRVPRGPAVDGDGADRHRRRLAHPRLLDRLHARRPPLRALLRLPEPVRRSSCWSWSWRTTSWCMFVGWEGVGLCSYLLIGFWFERKSARRRGEEGVHRRPRIGDAAFLIGIVLHRGCSSARSTSRVGRSRAAPGLADRRRPRSSPCSCSSAPSASRAQLPLHVWLPDAMEGPTPVSALIHAATMVTAGVYLVVRADAFFELSPARPRPSSPSSACVTALYAGAVARSPRTTSSGCSPTRPSASSASCSSAAGVGAYRRGDLPARRPRVLHVHASRPTATAPAASTASGSAHASRSNPRFGGSASTRARTGRRAAS